MKLITCLINVSQTWRMIKTFMWNQEHNRVYLKCSNIILWINRWWMKLKNRIKHFPRENIFLEKNTNNNNILSKKTVIN